MSRKSERGPSRLPCTLLPYLPVELIFLHQSFPWVCPCSGCCTEPPQPCEPDCTFCSLHFPMVVLKPHGGRSMLGDSVGFQPSGCGTALRVGLGFHPGPQCLTQSLAHSRCAGSASFVDLGRDDRQVPSAVRGWHLTPPVGP